MGWRFWLRWSSRDLRARRLQVIAIALVIALGTGMATSLDSTAVWRVRSNDASFAAMRAHDLRVSLPEGGFVRQGTLARAVRGVNGVGPARERLVVATQVDASRPGETILVPGRIVGAPVDAEPVVDALDARAGRLLRPTDTGRPTGVLEYSFAHDRGLPASGTISLSGGHRLRYVGTAQQPEYFIVAAPGLSFGAQASFAVVFTSLASAQRLTGHAGDVNGLVLRAAPGADPDAVERRVEGALDRALPGVRPTLTRGEQESAYRVLYKDAEGDQRVQRVFALLVLLGAAFAAYNLTSRAVEAQRRQIGIGMAIGVRPATLGLRPLLMGAEIAVLGAAFGVLAGLLLGRVLRAQLETQLPLPMIETPFQLGRFAQGAALGVLLSLLATVIPVWRAVRMEPIRAIRVGFRTAGDGGLAPVLARLRIPGGSLAQMPLRNVVRAPRRTLVTVLGLAAIVAVVVAFVGLVDSFVAPIDRSRAETLRAAPDRLTVDLTGYLTVGSPEVEAIEGAPAVGSARPAVALPSTLNRGDSAVEVSLTVFDAGAPGWLPSVRQGRWGPGADGVLIAKQAAKDLGVAPGDTIVVRHPKLLARGRVVAARSAVRVAGIHADPLRFPAYADADAWGPRTGLSGMANTIDVRPAPGVSEDQVKRALFRRAGVASVASAAGPVTALSDRIDEFLAYLYVAEGVVLALALLMAFNSASISADERAREHATMFAYGVPVRTVLRQGVVEGALTGLLATIAGALLGILLVRWIMGSVVQETFPDLGTDVALGLDTWLAAFLVGVVACALAPLLTGRRLRRMDVASTLRVME